MHAADATAPLASDGEVPFVYEHRQRILFLVVVAGLLVASHAVDLAIRGGPHWAALAVRLTWAGLLLATAAVIRRGVRRHMEWMAAVAAFGTVACYLALVQLTGRSGTQILSFAYVLAMTLPVLMPEALQVALPAGLLLLAGTWEVLWRRGTPAGELAGWGHVGLVALGIGWLLAHALRRAKLAEVAAAAAREAVQARLAASERRAAEADKLAALGAMSREIAHEINNPLSAARATVGFLRDRLPAGDQEGREACADLKEALDRIAASVWRLRQENQPPRPLDGAAGSGAADRAD